MREVLAFAIGELLHGIWKWIAVGVLISSAISVLVPQNALSGKAWATGLTGMVVMLLISLPLYVCATGSVPIAASLVTAGMSPGTALVFLMVGPATNAVTLGTVYKTFGKRVLSVYLATLIAGSMLLGWVFDFVIPAGTAHEHAMHASHPGLLASVAALALIALLGWYAVSDLNAWLAKQRFGSRKPENGESLALAVSGMTCANCARSVRTALLRLPGVTRVSVELGTGTVSISGVELNTTELSKAVNEIGFEVLTPAE